MVELDLINLKLLFNIFRKLENYTPYIFLRDGIKTLTVEKIYNKIDLQNLINLYQQQILNEIAGNIVFVSDD